MPALEKIIHLRVDPDSCDENLAAALHDVGAGEDHGVHRRPLLNLVRLTRQAALVNLLYRDPCTWQVETSFFPPAQ